MQQIIFSLNSLIYFIFEGWKTEERIKSKVKRIKAVYGCKTEPEEENNGRGLTQSSIPALEPLVLALAPTSYLNPLFSL